MPQQSAPLPPRLSDLHGSERVQALRARAAAHREQFAQRQNDRMGTRLLPKWVARLVG